MSKNIKDVLGGRMDSNYQKSKGGFISIIEAPEGTNFFKRENGNHTIAIIPYKIASKNHPLVVSGEAEIGEIDYHLDIWAHSRIGVESGSYLCMRKTYGQPCPICEKYNEALAKYGKDDDRTKAFKPTQRAVYNVLDYSDGEVKLWDVSYFLFEKKWLEARNAFKEDGDIINPTYSKKGYSIRFKDLGQKAGFNQFDVFRFLKIEDFDEDILEKAISLGSLLVLPDTKKLKDILAGGSSIEEDEDEYDDYIEQEEKEQLLKTSKKEEKEEDEDEEETPECPNGLTFGVDFEIDEDCEECEQSIWKKCRKANKRS